VVIVAEQPNIVLIGDGRLARHLRRHFQHLGLNHADLVKTHGGGAARSGARAVHARAPGDQRPRNFRLFSIFSRLIRRPAAFSAPAGVPNPLIRLEPDLEKRGLCPGVVSKRSLSTTNRSSN